MINDNRVYSFRSGQAVGGQDDGAKYKLEWTGVDHGGPQPRPLLRLYVGFRKNEGSTNNYCIDRQAKAQHPEGMKHSTTLLRLQTMIQPFNSSKI